MAKAITKEEAVTRLRDIHAVYLQGITVTTEQEMTEFMNTLRERDDLKRAYNLDNQGNEL